MKTKFLFISAFILFAFLGCEDNSKKEEPIILNEDEYLIFGSFYGHCVGESCIKIFRLEKDQLLEDTMDIYPGQHFYEAKYVKLSQEKFEITKDLINFFPMELLEEQNTRIGMPDAGDWGGYYVEYKKGKLRAFWLLDTKKSNVPEKYHVFIDVMQKKIEQLKE